MSFDKSPKDNIFSVPPDNVDGECISYIIVQVSQYRHVVAEYDSGGRKGKNPLSFRVVSQPMRYIDAIDFARECLQRRRK